MIEAIPRYNHVVLNNCREITVSLRDLAPNPRSLPKQNRYCIEKNADISFSLQHSEITHTRNERNNVTDDSSFENCDVNLLRLSETQVEERKMT